MSINKIVFTGAPCSGKTEILRKLEKYYKDKTDCVFVCEEAASEVKKSGAEFFDIYDFQKAVYEKQIENENKIEEQIKDLADKNVLVFYDRGVCDGYSYVDDENRFFNIIGESRYASFFRYDTALLFEIFAASLIIFIVWSEIRSKSRIQYTSKFHFAYSSTITLRFAI